MNSESLSVDAEYRKKLLVASEILFFLSVAFTFIWWIRPGPHDWLKVFAAVGMFLWTLYSNILRRYSLKRIGVRLDNFARAFAFPLLFTLIAAIVMLIVGKVAGTAAIDSNMLRSEAIFLGSAFLQNYLVQSFVNNRFQQVFSNRHVVAGLTAITFSLLHMPNPGLMVATLVAGYVWALSFHKHSNLITISLSHFVLVSIFDLTIGEPLIMNMRFGPRYYF